MTTEPYPRWLNLKAASRYSGLSLRLLQDYVRLGFVVSYLAKRPGAARGRRLIDRLSLDRFIQTGSAEAP